MSKAKIVIYSGILVAAICAGFFLFQKSQSAAYSNATEVDWRQLGEMDYITGAAPAALKALDDQDVRIPGFMVPLEDNSKRVTEFLLVPSPQACIHVPPPPSNQMVFVEMDETAHAKVEFGPIWIYGKLSLHSKRHMYGEASFTMKGTHIEAYR